MYTGTSRFLRLINNPFKLRLFLLAKLPSAFFSGVRVLLADEDKCVVTVPYKWFSKNPFRSTYFACLSMAAEMSTGVLAMTHVFERQPAVSMLVLKIQGNFSKKAVGRTTFTCEEGAAIRQCIESAIAAGQPRIITAKSYGRNAANEIVAEFDITWTFKVKDRS
ncbi:MAG: thioesterase [Ferruginibacter sp.]